MNLNDDDFTLFNLPRTYAQDMATIDTRWKALQRQAHPDKFAAQGAAAQRLAMQWSVRINEAHKRLKDPLLRATYLCQLHGIVIDTERNTAMPTAFLMQQMQWREALEDAGRDEDALQNLLEQAQQWQSAALSHCAVLLDEKQDWAGAAEVVRQLLFVEKFLQEVENRFPL